MLQKAVLTKDGIPLPLTPLFNPVSRFSSWGIDWCYYFFSLSHSPAASSYSLSFCVCVLSLVCL